MVRIIFECHNINNIFFKQKLLLLFALTIFAFNYFTQNMLYQYLKLSFKNLSVF